MPGRHNVQNALAAIAVSIEMGCPDEVICNGFSAFGGVRRRFTKVGEVPSGDGVATIIDDYGHHPVEIRAVLGAARESAGDGRVIAVVQPHRYTRLRDLMDEFQSCFNEADEVYVTAGHKGRPEAVQKKGVQAGVGVSVSITAPPVVGIYIYIYIYIRVG